MNPNNPGNQRDRGPQEHYVSQPYELPASTRVRRIRWQSELPAKTWVKAQLRVSHSRQSLDSAPWRGAEGVDSWFAPEIQQKA